MTMATSSLLDSEVTSISSDNCTRADCVEQPLAALKQRNEALVNVEIGVQTFIFVLAVSSNALVLGILIVVSRRKDLGRMYTMIAHLSCADLFVAFFNLLPQSRIVCLALYAQLLWDITYRFYGGRVLCKFVKYTQLLVLYSSSFVLVSTAIDRYAAICHPMRTHSWTAASAHRLVAVSWLAAALCAAPQLAIFDYVELDPPGSGIYDCWDHFDPAWTLPLYVTWFATAVYVVPLMFLAVIYARICWVVWRSAASAPPLLSPPSLVVSASDGRRQQREQSTATTPSLSVSSGSGAKRHSVRRSLSAACTDGEQSMSKAKAKTVKLTLTVVISYAVCWGPFFAAQLWSAWDPNAPFEDEVMVIILLLASINSCTNPWIYIAFSDHLRRRVLRCCRRALHRLADRRPQQQQPLTAASLSTGSWPPSQQLFQPPSDDRRRQRDFAASSSHLRPEVAAMVMDEAPR